MEDHHELNKSVGGAHIVRFIKAQRLKWWGHIHRMEECRIVRRILEWSPVGKRSRGHQIDGGLKGIGILGMKYWTKVVMDRLALHDYVEKFKSTEGCRTKEEEEEVIHKCFIRLFFFLSV